MDLLGGNMICATKEICNKFNVQSPEQAKRICDSYGSRCKGFVYVIKSGSVHLKGELENNMVFTEGYELFIKRSFAQKAQQNSKCVIRLDQSESFTDRCRLPDLDPFDEGITKLIQKPELLRCPGSQLTRYRRGVLELTEDKNKGKRAERANMSAVSLLKDINTLASHTIFIYSHMASKSY